MKFAIVFTVVLACAAADIVHDKDDPIVKSSFDVSPEGAYQWAYETGKGIYAQAHGEVKNPNSEHPSQVVQGAYKYTSPEGVPIELTYTADEEGYKPQGSHLPVPPPVPEAIARSLAYIAAHPSAAVTSPPTNPKPTYGK